MNAQAKAIPYSQSPTHLGRRFFTEFHLYRQDTPNSAPVVKAELDNRETALDVLAAVNVGRVGEERYFLVQATFEVIA